MADKITILGVDNLGLMNAGLVEILTPDFFPKFGRIRASLLVS